MCLSNRQLMSKVSKSKLNFYLSWTDGNTFWNTLAVSITKYLTTKSLTEMASDLSKVLSYIRSSWRSHKLKPSAQSTVTYSNVMFCVKEHWLQRKVKSDTMIKDHRVSLGWIVKKFKKKILIFSHLHINRAYVHDIFSESLLNTDTRLIHTLRHVPLVSVLTRFDCITSKGLTQNFKQASNLLAGIQQKNTNMCISFQSE